MVATCIVAFGLLGLNDYYTIIEMSGCVGMRLCRIPTQFFR
jgi:hypothetical protein